MTLQLWYWIIIFIWLLFGFWYDSLPTPIPVYRSGRHVLTFILFIIIGWQVFGSPVK